MTNTIFKEYAFIRAQIEELQAKEAVLKETLVTSMINDGTKTSKNDYGQFTISIPKVYTYSKKLLGLQSKLDLEYEKQNQKIKDLKKVEEEKGIAILSEGKPRMTFTPIKK